MTSDQKRRIEETIKAFQPGTFQQFMLKFLPIYDSNYDGIIPVGGSASGKTRAGSPDLLKTASNGDQYGCDCGTEDRYWFPKDKLDEWKPIEDGEKSLAKLLQPVELVLASTQPIPHNHPNAKTIISQHFVKKSSCRIVPLSSSDLATFIEKRINDPAVFPLLAEFFAEIFQHHLLAVKAETLQKTVSQSAKLGFPTLEIQKVIESESGIRTEEQVRDLILTELLGNDQYQTKIQTIDGLIKRVEARLPELANPAGKFLELSGTPKIGKTKLCEEAIAKLGAKYRWFRTPVDERFKSDFLDHVRFALYSSFWSKEEAYKIVHGHQNGPLAKATLNPEFQVFVIDDGHLLSAEQLSLLNRTLKDLKTLGQVSCISIVVSTNRPLATDLSALDRSLVAPKWTGAELGEFLARESIAIGDSDSKNYLELLAVKSCGHPLYAKFLAPTYPTREKLIIETLGASGIMESELSKEVTSILYRDILKTPHQQNFVQRLSVLFGKAIPPVLECLRTGITPVIDPSVANLYEQIGPAVLDGTVSEGLQVSPTFKEVAKERISRSESEAVYRLVASVLVKPVSGNQLSAPNVLDGITYFLFCKDIAQAAMWATMLLRSVLSEDDRDSESEPSVTEKLQYLLDRLSLLQVVKPSGKPLEDAALWSVQFQMSIYYGKIGKGDEAAELLERINLDAIDGHIKAGGAYVGVLKELREAVILSRFLRVAHSKDPDGDICLYLDLHPNRQKDSKFPEFSRLFVMGILSIPPERLAKLKFNEIAKKLYAVGLYGQFAKLAIDLGLKAQRNPALLTKLGELAGDTVAEKVFSAIVKSSINAHAPNRDNRGSFEALEVAERLLESDGKMAKQLGADYLQHKADALFFLPNYDAAITVYKESCEVNAGAEPWIDGWNNFKIGVVSKYSKEIEQSLIRAKENLVRVGNYNFAGRALGALAAHYLIAGDYEKALRHGKELAGLYHGDGRKEVGPALFLLTNNMLSLTLGESRRQSFTPEEVSQLHPPNLRYFDTILEEVRPRSGGVVTYQAMAMLAEKVGLKDVEIDLLKNALGSEALDENDRAALALAWHRLIAGSDPAELTQEELTRYFERAAKFQPAPGAEMERGFFGIIFKPFVDGSTENAAGWAKVCLSLADIVSWYRKTLDQSLSEPWALWEEFVKGLGLLGEGKNRESIAVFSEARRVAMGKKQWSMASDLAFYPAFKLARFQPSLRDAAEAQYQNFLCLEKFGLTEEIVASFGGNLVKFWDSEVRRLSEKDLHVKEHTMDVVRTLKTQGFTSPEIAPILVSSLLKASNHSDTHDEVLKFPKAPPPEMLALTMKGKA